MSRIGLQPIQLPSGVTLSEAERQVSVEGPKGTMTLSLPEGIDVESEGTEVRVKRVSDEYRASHGLIRSLLANMVKGVTDGFTRELQINGVGFRAALEGSTLSLSLGFASPISFKVPDTVTVTVNNNTEIVVSGMDKQQVGDVAAQIRSFYPAEPYKGKGVQYKGERIRRKVGKTVA